MNTKPQNQYVSKVTIADLRNSQLSESVYSHDVTPDLVDSIKRNGVLIPISITSDNIIISGHRRVNACKLLGITEIEAEIKEYTDLLVIESNRYREKTWKEKLREADILEKILKPKALEREIAGKKMDTEDPNHMCDQGSVLEKTAKLLNTSHNTLHKVKVIAKEKPELIKKIDEGKKTVNAVYKEVISDIRRNNEIKEIKKIRDTEKANIEIRKGDFKKVLNDLTAIDVIITDPPYPKEYLDCFTDLSIFANKKLKDGGFLVVYSGQYHLPEVIKRLSEYLTYVWTFCLNHAGKKQLVNGLNIMCGWKPILIFSRGNKKMRYSAYDVIISESIEKYSHKWQQSESGVKQLIEIFSKPGDLIVDPFCGSGTTGVVAKEMGRNFIGAEIDDTK